MRYLQKFGSQRNLMTYFFDYITLSTNKMQSINGQNTAPSLFPGKGTLELLRTTEA